MGDRGRVGRGPQGDEIEAGVIESDKVGAGGRANGHDIGAGAMGTMVGTLMARRRSRRDRLDSRGRREAHIIVGGNGLLLLLAVIVVGVVALGKGGAAGIGVIEPALGIGDEIKPGVTAGGIQHAAIQVAIVD